MASAGMWGNGRFVLLHGVVPSKIPAGNGPAWMEAVET
jgi:hypothetical protein